MADCVRDWVSPHQRAAEPADEALARRYDRLFPSYQQSRIALRPVWHALSQGAASGLQQERLK
ncbi:Erythritol kinase [compost metagenome]